VTRTASEVGAASRRKGVKAERDLARYLRTWWPHAERKADNGWKTTDRESADHGDIRGTPALVWQLKAAADMNTVDIEHALGDAEDQAVAAGADYGVLVQRRQGKSDAGRWWAWQRVGDLCHLTSGRKVGRKVFSTSGVEAPVRLELRDLVTLLVAGGYGEETT
jgi:hypothetical protein